MAITSVTLMGILAACGNGKEGPLLPPPPSGGYIGFAPPGLDLNETPVIPPGDDHEVASQQIIINGEGTWFEFYTPEGEMFPTHVPFGVIFQLGLDAISAGSQMSIMRDDASLAFVEVLNYLATGEDRVAVGPNDAFMSEYYLEVYLPISLFRDMGFEAYFAGGHVFINEDASDMS